MIWSGLGFFVAVFVFASSFIAQLITETYFGPNTYVDVYKWPFGLALIVAAIPTWFFGNLIAKDDAKTYIEKDTGKELTLRRSHSLFFIEMRWWAPILVVIGLGFVVFDVL